MKRTSKTPVQSVSYPSDTEYTPRFVEVANRPRPEYHVPGAPLEAALLMGSVTKEDLISINPGLKRAIRRYNPSDGCAVGFIGLAQHYLFWTLRGTGIGAGLIYDGAKLTDAGKIYMRSMELDPDRLPELSVDDRKKLKDDLALAVDTAFQLLRQKQTPKRKPRTK